MKKKKQTSDSIKAMRKGNREAYQEILGPGFHAMTKVFKCAKDYTRKQKHKVSYAYC